MRKTAIGAPGDDDGGSIFTAETRAALGMAQVAEMFDVPAGLAFGVDEPTEPPKSLGEQLRRLAEQEPFTFTKGAPYGDAIVETFDTDGFHDAATNPGRITILAGMDGMYAIAATPIASTSPHTHIELRAYRPGGEYAVLDRSVFAASAGAGKRNVVVTLAAGDYITLDGYQRIALTRIDAPTKRLHAGTQGVSIERRPR